MHHVLCANLQFKEARKGKVTQMLLQVAAAEEGELGGSLKRCKLRAYTNPWIFFQKDAETEEK